jgi:hypothetical protein
MTVQTVSFAGDLLLILTAAAVVVLLLAAIVQVARGRQPSAVTLTGVVGVVVGAYGGVLLAVGLSSTSQELMPGDVKCFDDWCATMLQAHRDGAAGPVHIDVQLQNRALGRQMHSELARAYLELKDGGELMPLDGRAMQTWLQPGQRVDIELTFPAARNSNPIRFVVVEGTPGSIPGIFEIGGEGSPFHARAGWSL